MAHSHEFEICREAYHVARSQGAPAILVHKISPDYMLVEASDGSMRSEMGNCCCKWAAKYDMARAWLDRRDEEAKKAQNTEGGE